MTLVSGARLGPYEIVDLLGRGGMGEVYRAVDNRLGRQVAIKVLPSHLAADAESLVRFRREARAVAALSHPNIVSIFDIGNQADTPFVVTELLDGETLRVRLERGRLPVAESLRIASAIADGLAAAHAKGIIHRDLKPENVMLTRAGGVKILDFGLASTRRGPTPAEADSLTRTEVLTSPGVVMGTIGYTSPEQLRGRPATEAADIFSFGCVAYEMLVGAMPFRRDSNLEVIASVLLDEPFHRDSAAGIPIDVREVVERCLEKDPEDRFQNGGELASAVHGVIAAHAGQYDVTAPTSRPRKFRRARAKWIAGIAIAAMVAVAIAIVMFAAKREHVIDNGYDLRLTDVTGTPETRRLTEVALRADASGNRSEAIELFREAARLDPHAPLPAAFLSSFIYYDGNTTEGLRWATETKKRLPYASSTYETLLSRYLMPDGDGVTEMALSSSILDLRPSAWRLRLSLAHQHLNRRELPAALAQLQQIDVSAPDDRRLAIVLADRASTGDVAGAVSALAHSKVVWRPELLAYARGRIAWSGGHAAEAAKQFESAAEHATISNFATVALDAAVLGGVARIGNGDFDLAQSELDVVAVRAQQAKLPEPEVEAYAFGAYAALRRGDREGMQRRLRLAAALAEDDTAAQTSLRLFALRLGVASQKEDAPAVVGTEKNAGIDSLIAARRAWAHHDLAGASTLLARSESEGIATTWFAEEAALLAYDLGAPPRRFRPDPPYPNRLRFIAIWELGQPRRQPL